jgi:SHS2 domain-containing protein
MNGACGHYELFDHSADIGIRVSAPSCAALFAVAGRALMDWIGPPPTSGEFCSRDLHLRAEDLEELMVRWLQELIYEFQHHHNYTERAEKLEVSTGSLQTILVGRIWDESSHGNYREVKAVTYHHLVVIQEGSLWRANIILDV